MAGPGGIETGRVFVKIAPRFDEFRTELKSELTKISGSKKYQVKVDAIPAFTKFKQELASKLKIISEQAKVKIGIEANTSKLLAETRLKLKPLDNRLNLKVNVTPDFKQFSALYKKGLIDAGNSLHADLGTLGKVTFDSTPLENLKNQAAQTSDQIKRDFETFKNESRLASDTQASEFKKLQAIELESVKSNQSKELEEIKTKNKSALFAEKNRYRELDKENKKLSKGLKDDYDKVEKHVKSVFGALQSSLSKITKFSAFSVLGAIAASSIQSVAALGALGVAAVQASIGLAGVAVGLTAIAGIGLGGLVLAFSGISDALGSLVSGNIDKFNTSLSKLTPSAQKFVKAFLPFMSIGRVIQELTFDGLDKKMNELVKLMGVDFKGAAVSVGDTLNKSIGGVIDKLKDPSILASLKNVLTNATGNLDKLSTIPATLIGALIRVGDAAGNATSLVTDKLVAAADKFGARIQEKFNNGDLQKAIDNGIAVAGQLLGIVGDIAVGIKNIFQAASAGGTSPLGQFAADFKTLTEDPKVQKGITAFFTGFGAALKPVMEALGQIATNIFPAIGAALIAIAPSFTGLFSTLGPVLAELVKQLAPVLSALADGLKPALEALTPAFKPLADILVTVIKLLSPSLVGIIELIGAALSILSPILKILTVQLTPFFSILAQAVGVLTTVIDQMSASLAPILDEVIQGFAHSFSVLGPIFVQLAQYFADLGKKYGPQLVQIFTKVADALTQIFESNGQVIFEGIQKVVNELIASGALDQMVKAFVDFAAVLAELFVQLETPLLEGLALAIVDLTQVVLPAVIAAINLFAFGLKALTDSLSLVTENLGGFATAMGTIANAAVHPISAIKDLGSNILGFNSKSKDGGKAAIAFGNAVRTMASSVTPAGTVIRNLLGDFNNAADGILKAANKIPGIGKPIASAINFLRNLSGEAIASANNTTSALARILGANANAEIGAEAIRPGGQLYAGSPAAKAAAARVAAAKKAAAAAASAAKAAKSASSANRSYSAAASRAGNQVSKGASKAKKAADAAALSMNKFRDALGGVQKGSRGTAAQIKAEFGTLNASIYGLAKPARLKISLLKVSHAVGAGLIALAGKRADLEKKISAADTQIKSLMEKRATLAGSIGETVGKGFNSVTDLLLDGLNSGTISRTLNNQLKIVQSFRDKILLLVGKGVNSQLIEQISQLGAQDGLKAATQLLKSTPAQLAAINAQQAALNDELSKVGDTVAGGLYDAGIKAAQGLKNGLLSQLAAVNAAATRLGNSLVAAMKKALGIHSPSKVLFDEIGVPSGQGVIGGFLSTKPTFDAALAGYTTFKANQFPQGGALLAASAANGGNSQLSGNLYLSSGEFLGVVKGAVSSVNDKEAKAMSMGQRVY